MDSYPEFSGAQPLRFSVMGSSGQHQNLSSPALMQFRPVDLRQQAYQFVPATSRQFQSIGQGVSASNIGVVVGQSQMNHFTQPRQQLLQGSGQASQALRSLDVIPMPYVQPNMPISSGSVQLSQNTRLPNNHEAMLGSVGMPLSMSFTYTTSNDQQPRRPTSMNASSMCVTVSQVQTHITPAQGQPWSTSAIECPPVSRPSVQVAQQSSVQVKAVNITKAEPNFSPVSCSDWLEHTSRDGRRYYYNKKIKKSTWEKPLELMTPLERADASTEWKECSTPEGRKFYYNKAKKQSKWMIPDELKMAREQSEKEGTQSDQVEGNACLVSVAFSVPSLELPRSSGTSNNSTRTMVSSAESSQNSVTLDASFVNSPNVVSSEPLSVSAAPAELSATSLETSNAVSRSIVSALNPPLLVSSSPASVSASLGIAADVVDAMVTTDKNNQDISPLLSGEVISDEAYKEALVEAKSVISSAGKTNIILLEEKSVIDEPLVYLSKQDAKNTFKALLESANIGSDWTWEQAMRVIINDKRYGALNTLGDRKQAFNEYTGQRKKEEVEYRRIKQKKACQDFTGMLEECKELTSSTRWSKVVVMFENDERFHAIEQAIEREDIFLTYLMELKKKERSKAAGEHKQIIMEYKALLRSCNFIKSNSQWRKVQDRLENDGRCSRIDKFDRLKYFQEYIHDLEKEQEEQRKIEKEQFRRTERTNRDDFRKLMEGHAANGIINAKTHWRDYLLKVKDLPSCVAVSTNMSGATPKDLFEDVAEDLEKQYHEDKTRIKDAVKIGKIGLASKMIFADFKNATLKDDNLQSISETNLKFIFDELIERLREREGKVAKKRQRLTENFCNLLHSTKEITASSTWEECKNLFESCHEYISIGEESYGRGIFENYVAELQERVNEEQQREERKASKERKEKEKRRNERKEKEKQLDKEKEARRHRKGEREHESTDKIYSSDLKENKRREKDRVGKHQKLNYRKYDEANSDKDEKKVSKRTDGHNSDLKKSQKHASTESESESRYKRHKKD